MAEQRYEYYCDVVQTGAFAALHATLNEMGRKGWRLRFGVRRSLFGVRPVRVAMGGAGAAPPNADRRTPHAAVPHTGGFAVHGDLLLVWERPFVTRDEGGEQ